MTGDKDESRDEKNFSDPAVIAAQEALLEHQAAQSRYQSKSDYQSNASHHSHHNKVEDHYRANRDDYRANGAQDFAQGLGNRSRDYSDDSIFGSETADRIAHVTKSIASLGSMLLNDIEHNKNHDDSEHSHSFSEGLTQFITDGLNDGFTGRTAREREQARAQDREHNWQGQWHDNGHEHYSSFEKGAKANDSTESGLAKGLKLFTVTRDPANAKSSDNKAIEVKDSFVADADNYASHADHADTKDKLFKVHSEGDKTTLGQKFISLLNSMSEQIEEAHEHAVNKSHDAVSEAKNLDEQIKLEALTESAQNGSAKLDNGHELSSYDSAFEIPKIYIRLTANDIFEALKPYHEAEQEEHSSLKAKEKPLTDAQAKKLDKAVKDEIAYGAPAHQEASHESLEAEAEALLDDGLNSHQRKN